MSLKENWPATFAEIRLLFDQPPGVTFDTRQWTAKATASSPAVIPSVTKSGG